MDKDMQKISPVENVKKFIQYYIGHVRFRYRYIDYEPGQWSVWVTMTHERYAQAVLDKSVVEVQIELRKLGSMTDEEIKELIGWEKISKMYLNTSYRKHQSGIRIVYDVDAGEEGVYPQDHFVNFREFDPQHFHYLLSRGLDLFGLIDAGLALDKETIKS